MTTTDLEQLELLARVDEIVGRLTQWTQAETAWEPMRHAQALIRRVLARAEGLRVRLESPLVVATFGGTGTGKSTLVNALVGRECTKTGRQRPTTRRPVLIAHPQTDVEALGLPIDDFEVTRADSTILRDIVIVDCPDPDTSESETPGSNLQKLHRLLPYCDVLIYTSTQQKYRSARVADELGQAATGCRLLFVQTHADLDEDIRDDWRRHLADHYEVPDLFFVDSVRAIREQFAEQRPSGDFGRLQDLLTTRLAASHRIQIRRANLVDLIQEALAHCRTSMASKWPAVEQLEAALEDERRKMTHQMAEQLSTELLQSRGLWERRLVEAVTQMWGFSPFSLMLRLYNGLGSLIAGLGFLRARNSAQMALVGAMQGARWLKSKQRQKDAQTQLARISTFGFDDALLRESQFVISGYVNSAQLDVEVASRSTLDDLRDEAIAVEERFLGDASSRIEQIIKSLAAKNSRWFIRFVFEAFFLSYVAFVLYRVGKNFFYDTFFRELISSGTAAIALLSVDFYVSAALFFVLWTGVLVMIFVGRLKMGLQTRIRQLAGELAESRMSRGLFPQLEGTCTQIAAGRLKLDALAEATHELRNRIATSNGLGARLAPAGEAPTILPRR